MLELLFILALVAAFTWSAWIDTIWIAGVALIVFSGASWLFTDLSHVAWLMDPFTIISLGILSLATGALWSLWKWRRHVRSPGVQEDLEKKMVMFIKDEERKKERFGESFKPQKFIDSADFPASATPSYNKERIMTWIVLWPFSMIVYFFEDFLVDIARWIYERLVKVYQRITLAAMPDNMK